MVDGLLSLRWNNHRSTFCHIISTLKQKESYSDATLACDGTFYPVHKLVLSVCSEYFENMLSKTPCKHPVIVLRDVQPNDLEALLSYMYDGSVSVAQDDLARFIKTAEMLRIKGLAVPDDPPPTDKGTKRPASPSHSRQGRDGRSPASRRKRRKEREESERSKSYDRGTDERGGSSEIEEVLMPVKQEIEEIEHNEDAFGSTSGVNQTEDSFSDYNVDSKDNIDLSLGQNLLSMSQDVGNVLPEGSDSQNPNNTGDGGGTSNLEPWLGDDLGDLDYGEGDYPSESGDSLQDSQGVQHQSFIQQREVYSASSRKQNQSSENYRNTSTTLGSEPSRPFVPPKLHQCQFCPYTSCKKTNVTNHSRVHTGDNPYKCSLCPMATKQLSNLKVHMLRKHGQGTAKNQKAHVGAEEDPIDYSFN